MAHIGAGRYAPSPSGALHLGNLRTAMLAWLFARSSDREFYMRIEDVDRGRDTGAADQQLDDLARLGLDWDGEPVVQTKRRDAHEAAIAKLAAQDLVYECFCTRREILDAPSAPHAPPGAYPGTCRNLTGTELLQARERIAPRKPALRLRAPDGVHALEFEDELLGRSRAAIDDFVLRRGDGAIAYNLAVVIDDADMGVDQVVRGDDLASSTPRQILLQRLLGLPTPTYAHVPLVLGLSGARLAKRDGAVSLHQLAGQGTTVHEVRSLLAHSLGLALPQEAVTMHDLLARFNPQQVPQEPWTYAAHSN